MGSIDAGSIAAKFIAHCETAGFKQMAAEKTEAEALAKAEELLSNLVDCVNQAIASSGLNGNAIAAVGEVSSTSMNKVGDGQFEGYVDISANSRPSLAPELYGGIDDMAALFNNGYTAGGAVYGMWHGQRIRSLTHRAATHFVQSAIDAFNESYGSGEGYTAVASLEGSRFE